LLSRSIRRAVFPALVLLAAVTAPAAAGTIPGTTERVSVASDGHQARGISGRFTAPAVSGDGRVVAFDAEAENLDPDDGSGFNDVFVHDRTTGRTDLVSARTGQSTPGNGDSQGPALNDDGTLVAFDTQATDLVQDVQDDNHTLDVVLRDRTAGRTELMSIAIDGGVGNAESFDADITPRGRYVLFLSAASNLVQHDDNRSRDIFVRDRLLGTTDLVSVASDGTPGNNFASGGAISDSGRYVAFASFANNLVPDDTNDAFDVFWHDRVTGETQLVSQSTTGEHGTVGFSAEPAISGDGRYVAFFSSADSLVPDDTNDTQDLFLRDVVAGTTERISVTSTEAQIHSPSGFSVHGGSTVPAVSADGRYVTFETGARHLVPEDTSGHIDVFRRDRVLGVTERVSVSDVEEQADGDSSDSAMNSAGDVIAFISLATNLVREDTNRCGSFGDFGECPDVFARSLE
jgi:Tol biopolymer transport system component